MDDVNTHSIEESSIHVQIRDHLDCLNKTSENINKLENLANEKRNEYRQVLSDSSRALSSLSKKLGDCITQARPYYEAKKDAKEALCLTQQSAINFDRAVSIHAAAREMVRVTESGIKRNSNNPLWFEMLNRANEKVVEAETEQFKCEIEHQKRASEFKIAEDRVKKLKNLLKSSIKRSRLYYELKRSNHEHLERISSSIKDIVKDLHRCKVTYAKALKNLESISNALHAMRQNSPSADLNERAYRQTDPVEELSASEGYEHTSRQEYGIIGKDLNFVDSLDQLESLTLMSSASTNLEDASLFSLRSHGSNDSIFSEAKVTFDRDESYPTTSKFSQVVERPNSFRLTQGNEERIETKLNGSDKSTLGARPKHPTSAVDEANVALKNIMFFRENSHLSSNNKLLKPTMSKYPSKNRFESSATSNAAVSTQSTSPSTYPPDYAVDENLLSSPPVSHSDKNSNLNDSSSKSSK